MDDSLFKTLAERYPRTKVMGYVDDLDQLIASSRAGLIADTVGGGFKLRLLSHVFQRLPIIGLCDAIAGLPTRDGEGYLSAVNLNQLVDLVCESIDDIGVLNSIHNKAFEECRKEFSWSHRAQAFSEAISGDGTHLL